jgi:hypothetical protein
MKAGYAGSRTLAEIDKLKDTQPDWDSYEASPVGLYEQEQAKAFVRAIGRLLDDEFVDPVVSPVADPGVALTWRKEAEEISVIFTPRGARYALIGYDDGPVQYGESFDRESDIASRFVTALRELIRR